jgi:hypothetical protein
MKRATAQTWVRRYLWTTGIVFMVLMGAALLKGRSLDDELSSAFLWALLSGTIFTGWRYRQARKGVACALCKDSAND